MLQEMDNVKTFYMVTLVRYSPFPLGRRGATSLPFTREGRAVSGGLNGRSGGLGSNNSRGWGGLVIVSCCNENIFYIPFLSL